MSEKKRMANMELLRVTAMLMIVVLHYLGKGNLLKPVSQETLTGTDYLAWILEAAAIVAVNLYMLLSGYLMCCSRFSLRRLISLYIQTWMFSVAVGLAGSLSGIMCETPRDIHFYLTLIFPVHMEHYWFITAYFYLYLLLIFVCPVIRRMEKRQLQITVLLFVTVFSLSKSILPLRMEMDQKGYDCIWYLCMFLVGAYLRRFGIPVLKKAYRGIIGYVLCTAGILGITYVLRLVYLSHGSFELMLKMAFEYNYILQALGAICLFTVFQNATVKGWMERFVCLIGPYTLGVYLLHENLGLRYTWQKWFWADQVGNSPLALIAGVVLACLVMLAAGIVADMLRRLVQDTLHRGLLHLPLYAALDRRIAEVDRSLRELSQGKDELVGK